MSDPAVAALANAVNDGLLEALASMGFSQSEVAAILAQAFPEAGISPNSSGGYTCPRGHDAEATELYNKITRAIIYI